MKKTSIQEPILSVVVPTKDRNRYAVDCIRSLLEVLSERLEVVVQDQSTSDALERALEPQLQDPRLRYFRDASPRNHVVNFNLAVSHATGTYVCVIGDDDGVSNEIVHAAEWAERMDVDALTPSQCANYSWPDFLHWLYGDGYASQLRVSPYSGKVQVRDPQAELDRYIQNPRRDIGGLPKIYHGLIRRRCLDALVEQAGGCFFGVSPDVAGGVAVASHVKRYWFIDFPLVIAGGSGGSAAGRGAMGAHKGSLRDDPHMRGFQDLEWPSPLPNVFCVETVLAEAAIEGLKATDDQARLDAYNYGGVYGLCLFHHPSYIGPVLSAAGRFLRAESGKSLPVVWGAGKTVATEALTLGRRVAWRLAHPRPGAEENCIPDIPNVREARIALASYVRTTGPQWTGVGP